MSPKTLNLAVLAGILGLLGFALLSVYKRGQASVRAETAEQALADSTEAYKRRTKHLESLLRADSAAEAVRLAMRAPVEPAVTRYVTLRDTIAFTDTLLIEAADEAVTTCSLALLACESRVSSADSVIAAQAAQIRNLEAQLRIAAAAAEAACDGRVPTWVAITGIVGGAAAGAWVRGN